MKKLLVGCRFEPASFDLLTKGAKGGNRMKYLLLIYMDESALSETEREHCYEQLGLPNAAIPPR